MQGSKERLLLSEEMLISILSFIREAKTRHMHWEWIADNRMKAYLRRGLRFIEGDRLTSLEIATVELDQDFQNRGLFSAFVRKVHALNPFDVTLLENCQSEIVRDWCRRNQWSEVHGSNSASFYLLK